MRLERAKFHTGDAARAYGLIPAVRAVLACGLWCDDKKEKKLNVEGKKMWLHKTTSQSKKNPRENLYASANSKKNYVQENE